MIIRPVFSVLLASIGLLAGCKKPVVESYRVPKETTAQAPTAENPHAKMSGGVASTAPGPGAGPATGSNMASTPVPTASGAGLTWTAPAHWKTKAGSAMRKGSYAVAGDGGEADVSITAFPGDVGGDLANLNRWRGQVQLPPVSQAEFESNVQRIERNGLKLIVVDLPGKGGDGQPQRILGAMVPHAGSTWFFKMQGPDALVAKEKPAFMTLLDSVKAAQ